MTEDFMGPIGPKPLSERLQVISTGNQLRVAAVLVDAKEVEKLVRILNANKELLNETDATAAGIACPHGYSDWNQCPDCRH
jgi:hypothetical protein